MSAKDTKEMKAKKIFEAIEGSLSDYVAELNLMQRYEPSDFISDIKNEATFDEEGNQISIEEVTGKLFVELEDSIETKNELVTSIFEELFENKTLEEIIYSNWWAFKNNCWFYSSKNKQFENKTAIAKAILRLDEEQGLNENHILLANNDKQTFRTLIQSYE